MMTEFTFYGDLLGLSSLYKLNQKSAYKKLNDFYNTIFYSNENWERENEVHTLMFSDSLIIYGKADIDGTLKQLLNIYVELLNKGILLRGAIVKGKLSFDPRISRENFKKMLPTDNVLARAAGLEGTQKGARLLIENALARKLLRNEPDWFTHEGYIGNVHGDNCAQHDSILRRVCPTPDQRSYELLYYWSCNHVENQEPIDYQKKCNELKETKQMVDKNVAVHYKETIALLMRCKRRNILTNKNIGLSGII